MKTSTVTTLAVGTGVLCMFGIVGIVAQADPVTGQDVAQVVETHEQRNEQMDRGNEDRKPVKIHKVTKPEPKVTRVPAKSDVPNGFQRIGSGVYLKWGGAPSYGGGASFKVWTKDGCDSLYIEGNWTDSNGTIVDYSNELIGNLPPKTKAKGEFITFDNSARRVKITEVNCY